MHMHCLLMHACMIDWHLIVFIIALENDLALGAPFNMVENEPRHVCSTVAHVQLFGYLCCTAQPLHVDSFSKQRCCSIQAGSTRGPSSRASQSPLASMTWEPCGNALSWPLSQGPPMPSQALSPPLDLLGPYSCRRTSCT